MFLWHSESFAKDYKQQQPAAAQFILLVAKQDLNSLVMHDQRAVYDYDIKQNMAS